MKKIVAPLLLLSATSLWGQVLPDTLQLREFHAVGYRPAANELGKKQVRIDSLQLVANAGRTIGELLGNETGMMLKAYGVNGVNTPALRGTAADHTAVMWNGLNLQGPTHGQFDFSLFPVFFTDEVRIEPGAGSGAYGSGAVGGAIILNNAAKFDAGLQARALFSAGSYGKKQAGVSAGYASENLTTNTRLYYNTAENNYKVEKFFVPEEKKYFRLNTPFAINNAMFLQQGFSQENAWRINNAQQVSNTFLFLDTKRPVINTNGRQHDRNFRNATKWGIKTGGYDINVTLGLQQDQLYYQDTISDIDSRTKCRFLSLQAGGSYYISSTQTLYAYIQGQHIKANVTGYGSAVPVQDRRAVWAGWQQKYFSQKLALDISGRQQWINGGMLPFIPSLGLQYIIFSGAVFKAHTAGVYHAPDLNDLYWVPGGNPGLKPEKGWSHEAGLFVKRKKFSAEFTVFSNRTRDLIVWLPGKEYWAPANVKEVWSRGFELFLKYGVTLISHHLQWEINYSSLRSQAVESDQVNDPSLNKQQICIPGNKLAATFNWQFKKWLTRITYGYTDRLYIYTDNSSWLPAYHLINARISRGVNYRSLSLEVFGVANNLGGSFYMPMPGYAMPGRNYEFGITLKTR